MSFGQRLRTRRKELGISQGELAKALGVSLSAVSNYETGHNAMREDVLLRLFSVLDVDPNYLYQDDFENKGPACGPEELQLLNKYRELDTGGRQALQAVADALCACQSDWRPRRRRPARSPSTAARRRRATPRRCLGRTLTSSTSPAQSPAGRNSQCASRGTPWSRSSRTAPLSTSTGTPCPTGT